MKAVVQTINLGGLRALLSLRPVPAMMIVMVIQNPLPGEPATLMLSPELYFTQTRGSGEGGVLEGNPILPMDLGRPDGAFQMTAGLGN